MESSEAIAIARGSSNLALPALPSEKPEEVPAIVVTWPLAVATFRILWLALSATYRSLLSELIVRPHGWLKAALLAPPLENPALPLPASVVTAPVDVATLRILLLNSSVM